MWRRWTALSAGTGLLIVGLLVFVQPAAAQHRGGGHDGGWHGGGRDGGWRGDGWGRGFSFGFYPGYGLGFGYNTGGYYPYYGRYYSPWYSTYAWPGTYDYSWYSYPSYANYGYYTSPTYYGNTYYPSMMGTTYANTGTTGYEGAYESEEGLGGTNPNAVSVDVRVPANAELWFNGDKTQQRGTFRQFVSPPVDPGKSYTYDIRAKWTDQNGKEVDQNRTITVHAGDHLTVNLMNRQGTSDTSGTSDRTGTDINNTDRTNRRNNTDRVNDFTNTPGADGKTPANTGRSTPATPSTTTPGNRPPAPDSNTVRPSRDRYNNEGNTQPDTQTPGAPKTGTNNNKPPQP